jgi:acylphosphatase
MLRRRVFVQGKVQGVSFRRGVELEAKHYPGLGGFVRNLPDGRVEAVFQGEDAAVLKMLAWCKQGPETADVDRLEVREEEPEEATQENKIFQIK